METEAGGWTIVQKRCSGLVDFDQTWKEYKMVSFGIDGPFSSQKRVVEMAIVVTMME